MPQPCVSTVSIGDTKFGALSVSVGFSTPSDNSGLPVMGGLSASIEVLVDIHDESNMPFSSLKSLFELAKVVTRDKIKDVKIEFWKDENRQDVICSYRLKGWISHWHITSGGAGNHTLVMSIQPSMDSRNFPDVTISN